MIISASRRTDIPAFYSDWFLKRLTEGTFLTPHPRAAARLGLARVTPDNLDCIVFWTKNAGPMLDKLKSIDQLGYRYYFTFTITAYGPDLEKNLPPKNEVVSTFQRLADKIGPERVDWRFDPIMVDEAHCSAWHLDRFSDLCRRLSGYTTRCIINFVKSYRHLGTRVKEMDDSDLKALARGMLGVAAEHRWGGDQTCSRTSNYSCNALRRRIAPFGARLPLFICSDRWNLAAEGLKLSACIDRRKIESLLGGPIRARKDPGQPSTCRCLESFDVGVYDTCAHACLYCYAVTNPERAQRRLAAHDPQAPMLTGSPTGGETVSDRTRPSLRDDQKRLF